jgi:hypothetical protein
MAHALNLTLPIKQDPETLAKLQHVKAIFAKEIQPKIDEALRESEIVHFARVLVVHDKYLQVITEYDGGRRSIPNSSGRPYPTFSRHCSPWRKGPHPSTTLTRRHSSNSRKASTCRRSVNQPRGLPTRTASPRDICSRPTGTGR